MESDEAYLRERIEVLQKQLEDGKLAHRKTELNLIIADLCAGRRRNVDDLPNELVADLHEALDKHIKVLAERLSILSSGATAAPPPPATSAAASAADAAKGQDGSKPM
ncbi:hypothetical protein ACP70R_048322 [Stipagrostis hirtigluma subsp. patula]